MRSGQTQAIHRKTFKPAKLLWLLFWPAAFLLTWWAKSAPDLVERAYSGAVYPVLAKVLGFIPSLLPFSLAEILLYLAVLILLVCLGLLISQLITHPKKFPKRLALGLLNLAIIAGILYFCFYAFWGFNYYRKPFAETAQMQTDTYSEEELATLCSGLIAHANVLRESVTEAPDGVATYTQDKAVYAKQVNALFNEAAQQYPTLKGDYSQPVRVLASKGLSYLGIEGIFTPYTYEANVNNDMPAFLIPAAMCHEAAHQRGFAREGEASFIAVIVCRFSDDPATQYSGTLLALQYAMNELYRSNPEFYAQLYNTYSPSLRADMAYDHNYWHAYKGEAQQATANLNDAYLKHNGQSAGIRSYDQVVALLIAEQRQWQ